MPCDYEMDVERRWVRSRAWGVLTLKELVEARRRFAADPAFQPEFCQLFDGREVTRVAMTAAEAGELAKDGVFSSQSRRAFVAPGRETHDLVRMYQFFRKVNAPSEPLRVFRTMEEAERWLAE